MNSEKDSERNEIEEEVESDAVAGLAAAAKKNHQIVEEADVEASLLDVNNQKNADKLKDDNQKVAEATAALVAEENAAKAKTIQMEPDNKTITLEEEEEKDKKNKNQKTPKIPDEEKKIEPKEAEIKKWGDLSMHIASGKDEGSGMNAFVSKHLNVTKIGNKFRGGKKPEKPEEPADKPGIDGKPTLETLAEDTPSTDPKAIADKFDNSSLKPSSETNKKPGSEIEEEEKLDDEKDKGMGMTQ